MMRSRGEWLAEIEQGPEVTGASAGMSRGGGRRLLMMARASLMAGLILSLTSCDEPGVVSGPEVGSIELSVLGGVLPVGESRQATVAVYGPSGEALSGVHLNWMSESEQVATVSSQGVVTAVAPGQTRIAAFARGTTGMATVVVQDTVPPTITTGSPLPDGQVDSTYSVQLAASGGETPYTWSMASGSLPGGLSLGSSSGVISGTPTAEGTSEFTVRVTGDDGLSSTKAFSLSVASVPAGPEALGVGFGDEQFSVIPAGAFQMGSTNGYPNEQPVHSVTISQSFSMQRTPVTQGQWREIMGSDPSYFSACGDSCPVEMVSWHDVQEFIQLLNQRYPGRNYRLPTEAEWEYAARAGTTGDYGGTGVLDQMGWHVGNSGNRTHPVALKQPNAWDLYDMHGNVWEWVQDWYEPYTAEAKTDPTGPASGSIRVLRGGSWESAAHSAVRNAFAPTLIYNISGFRLARTP